MWALTENSCRVRVQIASTCRQATALGHGCTYCIGDFCISGVVAHKGVMEPESAMQAHVKWLWGLGMESGHAWGVLGPGVQCMHGAKVSEGRGLRAAQQ